MAFFLRVPEFPITMLNPLSDDERPHVTFTSVCGGKKSQRKQSDILHAWLRLVIWKHARALAWLFVALWFNEALCASSERRRRRKKTKTNASVGPSWLFRLSLLSPVDFLQLEHGTAELNTPLLNYHKAHIYAHGHRKLRPGVMRYLSVQWWCYAFLCRAEASL